MDNRYFLENDNRSAQAFLMTFNSCDSFLLDLFRGNISSNDYAVTDFFQENSDYLEKIYYFPLDVRSLLYGNFVTPTTIGLGKKDCNYLTYEITALKNVELFSITVSRKHNNFLDFAPYTAIKLYVPYFPIIDLNPVKVYGYTLKGYLRVDIWTGKLGLFIEQVDAQNNNNLIYSNTVQIGIEVPIGKSNAQEIQRNNLLNGLSFLGSYLTMVAGAYSGNPITASMGLGLLSRTAVKSLSDNVEHLTGYSGGDGSRVEVACDKNIKLIIETPKDITLPDVTLKGGICKQNLSLSSVTGYTEIGEIHFNPYGYQIYDDEIKELTDLLRDGVIL